MDTASEFANFISKKQKLYRLVDGVRHYLPTLYLYDAFKDRGATQKEIRQMLQEMEEEIIVEIDGQLVMVFPSQGRRPRYFCFVEEAEITLCEHPGFMLGLGEGDWLEFTLLDRDRLEKMLQGPLTWPDVARYARDHLASDGRYSLTFKKLWEHFKDRISQQELSHMLKKAAKEKFFTLDGVQYKIFSKRFEGRYFVPR